jgi:hypothetical protein
MRAAADMINPPGAGGAGGPRPGADGTMSPGADGARHGPQGPGGGAPVSGASGAQGPDYVMSHIRRPTNNEDGVMSTTLDGLGAQMPPFKVAQTFSVETVFYPTPFGIHKFWEHMPPNMTEWLYEFCPEARVAAAP